MNPLEFLNQNPALTSILAFPIGLIILLGMLKSVGLDPKLFLTALKEHTAAELRIEERIKDAVEAIKNSAQIEQSNRQFFETKMDAFADRLERIQNDLTVMLSIAKKRRTDWLREPNTEVFRADRRKDDEKA